VGVPIVLDCDTGTDDAVAILCAVLHPGVDLLGVCTVWGNHDVRHTTDNTLRVLDLVGAGEVPVVPGLNGPFRGRATPLPSGRDDLPATLDLPEPTGRPYAGHAPDWLADLVGAHPQPVTVVATGPLSNLAAAIERHPDLVDRVDRVVCLAGTHEEPGVLPLVERNVWCDPEAAALVVDAGFADLTLVGMDATFSAPLDAADVAELRDLRTPAAAVAARLVEERIAWYADDEAMGPLGAAPLHDPMALAHVLDPAVLTTRPAAVVVDLADGPTYGRTVLDLEARAPTLRVALSADHDRYLGWLCGVLGEVLGPS
jgi:inosine-uridine nucleoside N-ribohydrolase